MKFSIIVVCLNPGEKLKSTLYSIKAQTFKDYEVIIKDGGSTDGSLDILKEMDGLNVSVEVSPDKGIYDAMNQAVNLAIGEYIYYLNCGDVFSDENVLLDISKSDSKDIIYGNIFDKLTNSKVASNPSINGFACFRNVPCHQACFYKRELIIQHPFEIKYKIRADYEQFLWCFYSALASMEYIDRIIAVYEGGGFSESKDNIKRSKEEHKEITSKYMRSKDIFRYKLILMLTLAPIRTLISHNPVTAKIYNGIKGIIYRR